MIHEANFVEIVQTSKLSDGTCIYTVHGRAPSGDATPDGDLVIDGWATSIFETTDLNEAREKEREFAARHGLISTGAVKKPKA